MLKIDAIERRYHNATLAIDSYETSADVTDAVEDIPALLAEVRRLRALIEKEEQDG